MARLPVSGEDKGTWGDILNTFLRQVHDDGGLLKADTVGATQLQDNSVTTVHLTPNSVTATQLADNSVTVDQLAPNSVGSDQLAPGVLTASDFADGSIARVKLAPLNITDADVSTAADIAQAKIAGLVSDLAGKVSTSDSRLSDARTPTAHASQHASGGSDPITATSIGALTQTNADGRYIRTVNNTTPDGTGNVTVASATEQYVTWDGNGTAPARPANSSTVTWSFPSNKDPATNTTVQEGDYWQYTTALTPPDITVRGTAQKNSGATNTTTVAQADFSVAPQSGDVLVAFVFGAAAGGGTQPAVSSVVPSGWTQRMGSANTAQGTAIAIYTKVAGGSEGSYTWQDTSGSGTNAMIVHILALTGADADTPVDAVTASVGSGFNNADQSLPIFIIPSSRSFRIGGFMTNNTTGSYTPGSGLVEYTDSLNPSGAVSLYASIAAKTNQQTGTTGGLANAIASSVNSATAYRTAAIAIRRSSVSPGTSLTRLVRRSGIWQSDAPGAVAHSQLTGLQNDDHPFYLNAERGDVRYPTKASLTLTLAAYATTAVLAGYYTKTEADGRYIRTVNATAPDSNGNVTLATGGTVTSVVPYHDHQRLLTPLRFVKHTSSVQISERTLSEGDHTFVLNNSPTTFTLDMPRTDIQTTFYNGQTIPRDPIGPIASATASPQDRELQHTITVTLIQDDVGGRSALFIGAVGGAPVATGNINSPATGANKATIYRFQWFGMAVGWVCTTVQSDLTLTYAPLPSSTTTYIRGYSYNATAGFVTNVVNALKMMPQAVRQALYAIGLSQEISDTQYTPTRVALNNNSITGLPAARSYMGPSYFAPICALETYTNPINPVLHENGHACDLLLYRSGVIYNNVTYYRIIDDPRFDALYQRALNGGSWSGRNAYFVVDNGGGGSSNGRSEWIAQMIGSYMYWKYLATNSLPTTTADTEFTYASPPDVVVDFKALVPTALSTWFT